MIVEPMTSNAGIIFPRKKMHGKMGSDPLLGQAMIIPKQRDFPVLEFLFLGGFEVLALNWKLI